MTQTQPKEGTTGEVILGFIVIGAIIYGIYWFFSPSAPETELELRTAIIETDSKSEKLELYQKLSKLSPEDESIKESIKTYERSVLIERAFSKWDGSHRELTKVIQSRLRDPSSYEHISTKFADNDSYITVITTYRATNGFGGKTIGQTTAKAKVSGEIIQIVN